MKPFFRVLAVDDGAFKPHTKSGTILVGVVYRAEKHLVEGIVSSRVRVDGFDSTKQIVGMLRKPKFKTQINFLILSGINFAGFNIADIKEIFAKTKIPVITVFRKKPRMEKIKAALSKLTRSKKRWGLIEQAGAVNAFKKIYFQFYGCTEADAKTVLRKTVLHSNLPEPIRLAHLIASGITRSESTRP
ncbi:MAG: DUF99 family protein [Candidatus Diapherotrites archaeon]|nr:DUF99 family protein [Candidatus Diapherotrites archaeon]